IRHERSVAPARRSGRDDQVAPVRGPQDAAGEAAMDDGKDALNEIDRTLAEALDVDVSPDFMARVQQRIASGPVRAPFWHGGLPALPVAAAAVVIVAAVVTMLSMRRPAAPPSLSARSL